MNTLVWVPLILVFMASNYYSYISGKFDGRIAAFEEMAEVSRRIHIEVMEENELRRVKR